MLDHAGWRDSVRSSTGEPLIGTPQAFGAMIAAETDKWKKVVEFAGAHVE